MRLSVKYLRYFRHNSFRHFSAASCSCSSQFSFRDTICRRVNARHYESSSRRILVASIQLYSGYSLRGISWVLSGFLSVTMVTHVERTQAWRAYRDVCDKVAFPLFLFFFFFLSRQFSDPSSKLYVQLLRFQLSSIAFVATSSYLRLELSLLTISTDSC